MFLLQKILFNNSIKKIDARRIIKDKLLKQTTSFLSKIYETVIEKVKHKGLKLSANSHVF